MKGLFLILFSTSYILLSFRLLDAAIKRKRKDSDAAESEDDSDDFVDEIEVPEKKTRAEPKKQRSEGSRKKSKVS